ncbi:ATP-dependent RecD-like DNA helicase [Mycoplasmatota bacterium]|nr:ATP-dependent RecD-like DNA helicase [Mycoplasmatota bacterium]
MSSVITGWYKKEIFYNEENDYHVGKIQVQKSDINSKIIKQYEKDGYIPIVGYMPKLLKDELYHFHGEFIQNNYGMQFSVHLHKMEEKKDEDSLILFLSSDLFKGIGKKTAKKIVSTLGENAIDKIIKDKSVLAGISGLNQNKINTIYDVLLINYEAEKIMRFLLKNGFGNRLSKKVFNKYKENTIHFLEENPYRLIDEIEGIGFKKADALGISLQFDLKSPYRIQAAIKYIFEVYCFNQGFTYITYEQLLNKAKLFLNENRISLTDEEISDNISQLINKNQIILDNKKYYLPILYHAEMTIVEKIHDLLSSDIENDFNDKEINDTILKIQDEVHIQYSKKQHLAIKQALQNKITILTGGPGTGKTTIINGFLKAYIKLNKLAKEDISSHMALVAPTGRAAKRMNETTGINAQTIHRLLGYQMTGEFTYDENNRLECKLIVIDESSMIDVRLLSNLLKALKNDVTIVFVGDINQLPSVGPGDVLKDLITSNMISTVKLEKIHRQKEESTIISLAHDINSQIITSDLLVKQVDRNFISSNNESILENLKYIMTNALDKKYSIDHIQVLAPMYKGIIGIDNINQFLQNCINQKTEEKKEINYFNKIYRLGDKVIQLVNKPEKNIMNGDIGYIKHVFTEDESENDTRLIVDFDGNEASFSETDLSELSLAYCISIHKSQGSEFDIVVLVLSKSYSIMLRKKLIYTAITRAKKFLIMLGDVEAYKLAVFNTRETARQTSLKDRLLALDNTSTITIDGFEFQYNPVKNVTVYDFLN